MKKALNLIRFHCSSHQQSDFPVLDQAWGVCYVAVIAHYPEYILHPFHLSFPMSYFLGAQVPNWLFLFPSYLVPCASFLQLWLYRSLSVSSQLVFNENCSTFRCVFWRIFWWLEVSSTSPISLTWSIDNCLFLWYTEFYSFLTKSDMI